MIPTISPSPSDKLTSSTARSMSNAREESPQPLRLDVDHQQQEHAQGQLPSVRRELHRIVLDELECYRTDEGREHAAGPAKHRDENKIARRDPECEVRGHMADEIGAEPADTSGDDVGRQNGVACGGAEVLDADLVVAHRLHEIAER